MRQPSRIEKEQAELLLALVEAYRLRREPFAVIEVTNAMGHVLVRHPGFTEEMSVPPNDLRMLEREGFLLVTERGRGIRFLIPTPEAQEFYRSVKTERSTPIARVETEVRQFLSSSAMDFYPRAFAAWRRSESLYRQLDAADPRLSEIGHQCREAIQAFAAEGGVPSGVEIEKWRILPVGSPTTNRPSGKTAAGGMRHGEAYQEVGAAA